MAAISQLTIEDQKKLGMMPERVSAQNLMLCGAAATGFEEEVVASGEVDSES